MAIFYTDTASFNSLTVTGSTVMSASANNFALNLIGSGSTIFSVSGSSGTIFTVTDATAPDTTLFSVATGSINIFSVDQSKNISLSGSVTITGSLLLNANSIVTSNQTSSFITSAQTSSFITSAQTSSFATTGSNNFNGNTTITGSLNISGGLATFRNGLTLTGSLSITGSLVMSPTSSFTLPISRSVSPSTGSMYWSGSLLFVYNGTRYMSASFV
jgi:hypothetical protein